MATSMSVDKVTLVNFTMEGGKPRVSAEGDCRTDHPRGANIFIKPYRYDPLLRKVSPGRLANGRFFFTLSQTLDTVDNKNRLTFVASPSEDGSLDPSSPEHFGMDLVIPPPTISSTQGGKNTASILGTGISGGRVNVTLDGQVLQSIINSSGGWSASFSEVTAGTHTVTAVIIDITSTLSDSAPARDSVTVTEPVVRPLQILYPPEAWPVTRETEVHGVASPQKGDVQVSLRAGGVDISPVEIASVSAAGDWRTKVRASEFRGEDAEVIARLPETGEEVSVKVKMKEFSLAKLSRAVQYINRDDNDVIYILIQGVSRCDDVIEYYGSSRDDPKLRWLEIATADKNGFWDYNLSHMVKRPDFFVRQVDGKRLLFFKLRLQGNNENTSEAFLPFGSVEVLSPAEGIPVTSPVVFSGRYAYRSDMVITMTLPDGTEIAIPPTEDKINWTSPPVELPLGYATISFMVDSPITIHELVNFSVFVVNPEVEALYL